MSDLDQALLAAHAAGDCAGLIRLYTQAADHEQDTDAAAFYLTHAYVFALEMGHVDAPALHQRLIDAGRDRPLDPPAPPRR